jgi:hypothetical protein
MATAKKKDISDKENSKPTCGIVMPISQIEDCSEAHWADVLTILKEGGNRSRI